tara:strand:- start:2434 stop:3543 length:1110 start_codon:yes stop_codon:yes gene_type:complete
MKKRILFPFSAKTRGGSTISSLMLIEKLQKKNFETVILMHGKGPGIEFLKKRKLDYIKTHILYYNENENFFNFLFKSIINFIPMIRILIRIKPSIIHLNDSKMVNTWTIFAKIFKLKIIIHQRTPLYRSRFLEYNLKKADGVIVISDYIRTSLDVLKLKNVHLVYNPFIHPTNDNKSLRENVCTKNNINKDSFIVGYFSRFDKRKRPELFIEASNKINGNNDIKFIMMGMFENKPFKNKIINLIRQKNLSEHIFIEEFNHNVFEALRTFDVLVCPAIDEGFGRTIIEAGLAKIPVIAAKSGAFRELINENETGLFFEPDNVNDLSNKILKIYSDHELRNHVRNNSYKIFNEKFVNNNYVEDLVNIYDNL